ncbi:hypothetical protein V8B97DRAFT_2025394 [Scleroderma yunnanense]
MPCAWTCLICIAEKAVLLVIRKYYTLMDDNEVYQIAIAMYPEKRHWAESYAGASSSSEIMASSDTDGQPKCKHSKWVVQDDDSEDEHSAVPEVNAAGGVLKYWENSHTTQHKLACMALDFLSAPALSVDAEHAFLGSLLQINLQNFKAQVAVGSWYNSPLLPRISSVAAIINNKVSKGKRMAVMIEDD